MKKSNISFLLCDPKDVPSDKICRNLYDYFVVPDSVRRHSEMVALVSDLMCKMLREEGIYLNQGLIRAASLLHDIARGKHNHAAVAAECILKLGYPDVSEIVAEHMILESIPLEPSEKEVVYLADKMVLNNHPVTIEERFSAKQLKLKGNKLALLELEKRKKQALEVYELIFYGKNHSF